MRGNQVADALQIQWQRSIPAHAGEPTRQTCNSQSAWVYPRTCGGTVAIDLVKLQMQGLSPHMRGNPSHWYDALIKPGSIPAHAGEPWTP